MSIKYVQKCDLDIAYKSLAEFTAYTNSTGETLIQRILMFCDDPTNISGKSWSSNTGNDALWNAMNQAIVSWQTQVSPNNKFSGNLENNKLIILVTLADGTVCYDSSSANNTYADFLTKTINENHMSRLSILTSMLNNEGIGYENKYSLSNIAYERYRATRIGLNSNEAIGCIRISYKDSDVV